MTRSTEIETGLEKIREELLKNPIPTKTVVINPSMLRETSCIIKGVCCDGIYPEREFKERLK